MRKFALLTLLAALPTLAGAERDYRNRYPDPGPARYRQNPVERALYDLEAVWSRARVDRHEDGHFRHAINDLRDFRERAARGHFDRGRLNSAIGNLDHLAGARQLHPRDRSILRENLYALRQMRDGRHDSGWYR